jgi:hypothetical protein
MLRRLRGLLGLALLWSIPWTVVAVGFALAVRVAGGYRQQRLDAYLALIDWPTWAGGGFGNLAAWGGLIGTANGLLFGAAILAAHRRGTTIDRLAGWQFALFGGLATGAVTSMLLQMPSAMIAFGGALGSLSGMAYLALAKRSALPAYPAFESDDAATARTWLHDFTRRIRRRPAPVA